METVDENFIAGDVMKTIKTSTPFNISIEGYDVIAFMIKESGAEINTEGGR